MKERSDIMVVDESMMSPRTKRQIRMYEELFRKFEDSGFDVSSLYDADKYVDPFAMQGSIDGDLVYGGLYRSFWSRVSRPLGRGGCQKEKK